MSRAPDYSRITLPDGSVFRVLSWGAEGEGDLAVIVHHGMGEHAGRYQSLVDGLSVARPVVGFDLRGHGHSSGVRGDADGLDGLADDFLALYPDLLERSGRARAVIYAHSLGGAVLARILTRRTLPDSVVGVVLSAPAIAVSKTMAMRVKARAGKLLKRLAPTLTLPTGLNAEGISSDPDEVKRYVDDPLIHDRISLRLADSLLSEGPEAVPLAGNVTLPLLLVHGDHDPIIPVDGSRGFAAGGHRLVIFAGGRHESHHEVPSIRTDLFEAVDGFLDAC